MITFAKAPVTERIIYLAVDFACQNILCQGVKQHKCHFAKGVNGTRPLFEPLFQVDPEKDCKSAP